MRPAQRREIDDADVGVDRAHRIVRPLAVHCGGIGSTLTGTGRNLLGWVDGRCAQGVIQSMTYGICELSKT